MTTPVHPDDEWNRRLVREVGPPGWVNPEPAPRYDLIVIGAGTAGLVSAAAAAALGARVALVERHLLGGDCLNVGCVPSKALLAAARAAATVREASAYGVHVGAPVVDFAEVMTRMRRLRASIAPHDSVHRFTRLGVDVFLGGARFTGRDTVAVDGRTLRFARAVVATGARAAVPPIPGLADAGFLTNETVFSLTELPRRLIVLGAGPIGCELAQAFRRFGADVTLIDRAELLSRDDPDAAAIVRGALEREGVRLALGTGVQRVERRGADKVVVHDRGEAIGDEILVALGRRANVEELDLDAARVAHDDKGVRVDDRLRTTNRRIYAAGDVCSRFQFTHAADAMARIVVRNALFFGRAKASALVIPWCTYTDPEVAHVGALDGARTFTVPLEDVDRAVLEGDTRGFARAHVDRRGRIVGATLVARHAGEAIGEAALALTRGLGLGALSSTIHPYPTHAEVWRRLGDEHERTRLTPTVKKLLEWILRWRWGSWRRSASIDSGSSSTPTPAGSARSSTASRRSS